MSLAPATRKRIAELLADMPAGLIPDKIRTEQQIIIQRKDVNDVHADMQRGWRP